jgi:murein DD-endopeptidase MepM/ murein hydrolase activator NlpD
MWLPKPYKISARITSPFGDRIHPITKEKKFHKGVDIGLPEGTELFAPLDGEITAGKDVSGYGNWLQLRSKTDQGTEVVFLFAHLKEVVLKSDVKKGELIALSGNTGASTGAHLHFEVRIFNGKDYNLVDPDKYFDLRNEVKA